MIKFSANYPHHGVRRRRPATLPSGSHFQEGRDESSRQDSPEEVRRSRQRSAFTHVLGRPGSDIV